MGKNGLHLTSFNSLYTYLAQSMSMLRWATIPFWCLDFDWNEIPNNKATNFCHDGSWLGQEGVNKRNKEWHEKGLFQFFRIEKENIELSNKNLTKKTNQGFAERNSK